MEKIRYKGLEALLDAYALEGHGSHYLYFLSLVGSREAVRGILAAWAKEDRLTLLPSGRNLYGSWRGKHFLVTRLGEGAYHGLGWASGYYFSREENPYAERLWTSRTVGIPIPEPLWQELRPVLLLEGKGVVALRPPARYQVEELLEKRREGLRR